MAIEILCLTCKGTGIVDDAPCTECGGKQKLTVDEIPKGYRDEVIKLHKKDIKGSLMHLTTRHT